MEVESTQVTQPATVTELQQAGNATAPAMTSAPPTSPFAGLASVAAASVSVGGAPATQQDAGLLPPAPGSRDSRGRKSARVDSDEEPSAARSLRESAEEMLVRIDRNTRATEWLRDQLLRTQRRLSSTCIVTTGWHRDDLPEKREELIRKRMNDLQMQDRDARDIETKQGRPSPDSDQPQWTSPVTLIHCRNAQRASMLLRKHIQAARSGRGWEHMGRTLWMAMGKTEDEMEQEQICKYCAGCLQERHALKIKLRRHGQGQWELHDTQVPLLHVSFWMADVEAEAPNANIADVIEQAWEHLLEGVSEVPYKVHVVVNPDLGLAHAADAWQGSASSAPTSSAPLLAQWGTPSPQQGLAAQPAHPLTQQLTQQQQVQGQQQHPAAALRGQQQQPSQQQQLSPAPQQPLQQRHVPHQQQQQQQQMLQPRAWGMRSQQTGMAKGKGKGSFKGKLKSLMGQRVGATLFG